MKILKVDQPLIAELRRLKIFLSYNGKSGPGDCYGWLKPDARLSLKADMKLEERTGLFGGIYKPSLGGVPYSGFCSIGSFSYSYSALPEPLQVGRYCSISNGLVFLDSQHPLDFVTTSIISYRAHNELVSDFVRCQPDFADDWHMHGGKRFPVIGHDVWIGRDVTMSMGITIGNGAVIAASSVVTKDVEPYTIVGGNPARFIRYRFPEELRSRLDNLAWWNYEPSLICSLGLRSPSLFCEKLEKIIQSEEPSVYRPQTLQLEAGRPV